MECGIFYYKILNHRRIRAQVEIPAFCCILKFIYPVTKTAAILPPCYTGSAVIFLSRYTSTYCTHFGSYIPNSFRRSFAKSPYRFCRNNLFLNLRILIPILLLDHNYPNLFYINCSKNKLINFAF